MNNKEKKNKLLWPILFFVIAALSVWAIKEQNKSFSFKEFSEFIGTAKISFIVGAFISVFMYIGFEALALKSITQIFGYKTSFLNNYFYASGDLYFSAITPSATGGQPACGYFMNKDGVPLMAATMVLIVNTFLYTFSLVIMGVLDLIINPKTILSFGPWSKFFIIFGILIQIVLATFFWLLIKKEYLLEKICSKFVRFLGKLKFVKNVDGKVEKINKKMDEYRDIAKMLEGKSKKFIIPLIYNLLMRCSLIAVSVFVYLATGNLAAGVGKVVSIQILVIIGAYVIPIPGAIGITDYIMIDGYKSLFDAKHAVNLELLSRSISFYACVLLCGILTLVKFILVNRRKK
ncbi:MAG: flippase-like domain-containing protein [Eubacterium sp.]|nr:flippase-like domain-containing protein [Eubacterium sp.]SEF42657.1 hypothetical protein SAMN04487934_101127 [Eubacterium ruminantium]